MEEKNKASRGAATEWSLASQGYAHADEPFKGHPPLPIYGTKMCAHRGHRVKDAINVMRRCQMVAWRPMWPLITERDHVERTDKYSTQMQSLGAIYVSNTCHIPAPAENHWIGLVTTDNTSAVVDHVTAIMIQREIQEEEESGEGILDHLEVDEQVDIDAHLFDRPPGRPELQPDAPAVALDPGQEIQIVAPQGISHIEAGYDGDALLHIVNTLDLPQQRENENVVPTREVHPS